MRRLTSWATTRGAKALVGVCLALGGLSGLTLLASRDSGQERAVPSRPPPDATRAPCLAGARTARACAVRAVRARADRDHPVQVRDVSCSASAAELHTFVCDVELPTTCDVYKARYADGLAVVTRPARGYCIHLEVVPRVTLDEDAGAGPAGE